MLFLQFVQYSFAGTSKNVIPGAVVELCQLKMMQFSSGILKFSTKYEENYFALNCFMVTRTVLFIFHADSRRLGSNNFRNSSYKEKTADSAVFPDYLSVSYGSDVSFDYEYDYLQVI